MEGDICPNCHNEKLITVVNHDLHYVYHCPECDYEEDTGAVWTQDRMYSTKFLINMNLNEWRDELHKLAVEKGFWDVSQNIPEKLMLCVSELGEAMEAHRNDDMDNFREEIADTMIRVLDLCGHLNIDIESEITIKHNYNKTRPRLHGKKY